jgi:hypothetical protein
MIARYPTKAAVHLARICGMFGSIHDGERAAAATKADAFVRSLGLTWFDVIALPTPQSTTLRCPPPDEDCRMLARWLLNEAGELLTEREHDFVVSMVSWRGEPSPRQRKWLLDIYTKAKSDVTQ